MLGRLCQILLLATIVVPVRTQDTGSSVVVVYNSRLPDSKAVAEHYVAKRQVPAANVIALDLPEGETISRDDYESKLRDPLWNELKNRGVFTAKEGSSSTNSSVAESMIRFAMLCYGVPLKILPDTSRKEEGSDKLPIELRRNEAAVDSELAVLPRYELKPNIYSAIPNSLYLTTNRTFLHPTNGLLMVTRLDGPSPAIAKGLVDKSMEAERVGLWGRAYFDFRGTTNGPLKMGDDWLRASADMTARYGFDVVTETSARTFAPSAPLSDIALYFGWYDQSVSGPFTNGMAQFRPGAIAYHIHSFSSRVLRVDDVWWTGPLLAKGATATMGCTEEPYLQMTPVISMFLSRLLYLGFSFAEAAYAAQPYLSWQITFIGDPLYRPFEKSQSARHAEVEARNDTNSLPWSMLMWINFRLGQGASLDEIEKFISDNPAAKKQPILQERLADIYRSKGKLLDAVEPYETLLKLEMPRLQRLRVTMNAASLFSSLSKLQEAYDLYQQVLRDYPEYPDKRDLYERLHRVAQRMNKSSEAAEYQRLAKELAK